MERKRGEVGEKERGNEERRGGGGREETEWREREGVHTMMTDT